MTRALALLKEELSRLSSAEDFLDHFGIPHDAAVLNVSRLHILKRFYQYLRQEGNLAALDGDALRHQCRALLERAYGDFVRSTPAREKVFKVLQDADGRRVSLEHLRRTLPSKTLN